MFIRALQTSSKSENEPAAFPTIPRSERIRPALRIDGGEKARNRTSWRQVTAARSEEGKIRFELYHARYRIHGPSRQSSQILHLGKVSFFLLSSIFSREYFQAE
jgi:hypothetical protein